MTNPDARLTAVYPACPAAIPDLHLEAGSFLVRFARTPEDLDQVLRLRYEIFNLELGEGLDESHATGRDEDELDARFHHLIIERRDSAMVVGTYRMQTAEMARAGGGFYADPEFDLSTLPAEVRDATVEIGRACVAKEHRNGRVLHLLWRGLASYSSGTGSPIPSGVARSPARIQPSASRSTGISSGPARSTPPSSSRPAPGASARLLQVKNSPPLTSRRCSSRICTSGPRCSVPPPSTACSRPSIG